MENYEDFIKEYKATEPGRFADMIDELVYKGEGYKLSADNLKDLRMAHHYLESLAFEELDRKIPLWVRGYDAAKKLRGVS